MARTERGVTVNDGLDHAALDRWITGNYGEDDVDFDEQAEEEKMSAAEALSDLLNDR